MKKTALGLFLVSSLVLGISTFSSADINNDDYLHSWINEDKNGEITLKWSRSAHYNYPARREDTYKIYVSPALSSKDFWENKKFEYKLVATVDSKDYYDEDDCTTDYRYFLDLEKNKFYCFKIEAYYGKELVCTHYCTNVNGSVEDMFPYEFKTEMKIDGNKGTLTWDKYLYDDATIKIYRSDVLTGCKYDYKDVSYKEIGSVPYEDGEFTLNDLKTGKNHYYGFVVYQGDEIVCKYFNEFGTMPDSPKNDYYKYKEYHFDKNYIEVPFFAEDNAEGTKVIPDGLIVYRKDKNGKFKEIAKVKQTNKNYVDKKVKAGGTYTYKARTYKKINGKTYYSKYSDEITLSAVNTIGKFKMSVGKKDRTIVKIESTDKDNGVIRAWEDGFSGSGEYYKDSIKIIKYSLDGKKWKKTDGTDLPALKPGKTIWFKLSGKMKKDGDYDINFYYGEGMREDIWYSLLYNVKKNSSKFILDNKG